MMWVCQQQWRLVGILKRVIVNPAVYQRFPKFLHADIQSSGHTLSRPRSRQPNYIMSEIECAQLHNELLGHRHSTLQLHGLFALAKLLYCTVSSHTICHMMYNIQTIIFLLN